MYAKNAGQLKSLILENPDALPESFLLDSSFAAHCFDKFSVKWLKSAFHRDADPDDCAIWNISPVEWKENIEMAYMAKVASASRSHQS